MRRIAPAFFLSCVALNGIAQERFGITHSNYAGTDAAYLNPARPAGQWPYADIRILGDDLFLWNSLVAWSHREQRFLGEVRSGFSGPTAGEVVLRGSTSARTHRGFVQENIPGPAFSLSMGRSTIGAGIRGRSYTSVTGLAPAMGNFIFNGLGYRPQHGIRYHDEGTRVLAAAWTEFTVSYAHILRAEGFGLFSAGASVHYHLGHAGGALQFDDLDYTVVDSAQLVVHQATARYGFAMPAFNAGTGWGADLGVTYERTIDEADGYMPHRASGGCDPLKYRYRIGLSLIDLGGIRFKRGESGTIASGSMIIPDYTHIQVNDVSDLDSLFASSTHWTSNDGFSIGAPTAVSLQYDQRVTGNTYVALAAVQQVSGRYSMRLRRTNSIAVTPRFETRYFEVAIPVVVHEYGIRQPSVGFMLRLNGLVLGSDHILPFLDRRDVNAADVYFRLRVMIFRSPFCKGKRTGGARHRAGGRDAMPCSMPR
ncbi:MAG: DUF5723 family protein [Flavobacteriales bacterium]